MSSRSVKRISRKRSLSLAPRLRELRITTDFDNTMTVPNTARLIISRYLFRGEGAFVDRFFFVLPLLYLHFGEKHLGRYYELLRRTSKEDRRASLQPTPINPSWLRVIKDLRMQHKCYTVRCTILSRNSVDVINEWLGLHKKELEQHHIIVETIIANKPIQDKQSEFIKEQMPIKHIDRAGFGQLQEEGKRKFLGKHEVYIGDAEEELMRTYVKQFVRV